MLALVLEIAFTVGFLILAIPLFALEMYGVWRKSKGDTITENWYALRRRYKWLVIPMAFFLIWLFYHFVVDGPWS